MIAPGIGNRIPTPLLLVNFILEQVLKPPVLRNSKRTHLRPLKESARKTPMSLYMSASVPRRFGHSSQIWVLMSQVTSS